jgi:hypothetical protein
MFEVLCALGVCAVRFCSEVIPARTMVHYNVAACPFFRVASCAFRRCRAVRALVSFTQGFSMEIEK